MRINHNISAQMANVNLKKTDSRLSASLERLSSGYKINKAADDSAGMAISNKMKAQIRALDQASRNSEDGQSIIETAEGAMGEIENILQRIRQLSVQTANGTYALEDREAAQKEVDQLLDEIDRITTTTEFNGTPLLDGSAARTFASSNINVKPVYASMEVEKGDYNLKIDKIAQPAEITFALPQAPASISIENTTIEINESMSADAAMESIQSVCDRMNMDVERKGDQVTICTRTTGSLQKIDFADENGTKTTVRGADAKLTLGEGFADTATYSSYGNLITIRDNEGFEMEIEANEVGDVKLRTFDAGYMTIQIGANESQILNMNFPEVSCLNLGLRTSDGTDTISVATQDGSLLTMDALDRAIKKVSNARSTLGSYQNRLEATNSSLDLSSQNITEAMSRISDTDMADEMTKYTQYEVLSQASTSMLAQANNRPQQILSLLQ